MKKHSNGKGNHYKSLNTLAQHSPRISLTQRTHATINKTISNSVADLSLSTHQPKTRLSTFQSKLDNYNNEFYKKIPLGQNYDWGMLAMTNTDLILLFNKEKNSLIIFDGNGHENEVKTNYTFSISSSSSYTFVLSFL